MLKYKWKYKLINEFIKLFIIKLLYNEILLFI